MVWSEHYLDNSMPHPRGRFCPFRIDAKDRLQPKRYISNKRLRCGGAFTLKQVEIHLIAGGWWSQ